MTEWFVSARRLASHDGEGGQAMVEFAFAATFFLFLLFGIIDFGRALSIYNLVTTDARMGTRWAIVRGAKCSAVSNCPATVANVQTYVRSMSTGLDTTQLIVLTTWPTATCSPVNNPGCIVSVTVSFPFHPVYRLGTINLTSTSQMIISN